MPKGQSLRDRIGQKCVQAGDCLVWTGTKNDDGYGQVYVNSKMELVHRVIWTANFGPIPHQIKVLHSCDNPACIKPSHLFLGTQKDNIQDAVKKNRMGKGLRLDSTVVDLIRARLLEGQSDRRIASALGVSVNSVWRIRNKRDSYE